MAGTDFPLLLLAGAVLALFGWYFVHVALRMRDGARAIRTLPGALERAFDGSVPPWLRFIRVLMIFLLCVVVAALIATKFDYKIQWLG